MKDNLKGVSTVVVVDGDKFLILQRSKTSRGAGFWNFPGGRIEEGETPEGAGARELKEEADIDVDEKDLEYLGELSTNKLRIYFYITDKFSGKVKINKESDDSKWITLSELDDHLFVGGGRIHPDLIELIASFIKEQ